MTLFALRSLINVVNPDRSLLDARFPLVASLPELRAEEEL